MGSEEIRHIVFIGETGAGKSSVINLFADRECSSISPDATPCTRDFFPCDVSIEGTTFRLWDTPGLNEASAFGIFRRSTSTAAIKRFLRERFHHGELDLLVFCVRGSRAHEGMSKAYKLFCQTTRRIAVPVVVAITNLERMQPTMDAWWQYNEQRLAKLGLLFDGHACLTCLPSHHRRWDSQQEIRFLVSAKYRRRAGSVLSDQSYLPDTSRCVIC